MRIPELLAPVGSREALAAAVQNGADAIYLGGKMFSARQYADNFDREELRAAFDYAHVRGVKVYITVNTLLADTEFPEALDYLNFLYENGADAVIVQDVGLAGASRKLIPELALHASTQMTVHNSEGAAFLKDNGFKRVVLARELSLREIDQIKTKTGVEIEVFVHGALCICYSGQCLMSSMIGGRSGNRGRCAQPCRMEYTLVDEKGAALADPTEVGSHLLSPKDLNMIRHIPELAGTGVTALKIEGRMKRPEYVATVTRIYRSALDRYKESPESYSVDARELQELTQIFNRGFTTGYFLDRPGRDMMSYKRPNNRGLRLGRVTAADWADKSVEILLEGSLSLGDGIEFWVTEGGRRGIVVSTMLANGKPVEEASAGQKVIVRAEGKIKPGDRVFKTHDAKLISGAEQSYKSSREIKKIPLRFEVKAQIGRPFEITVDDNEGCRFSAQSGYLGQEAVNRPLTRDLLAKQLDRLGSTPFAVGSLEADIAPKVMVPASEINEARRQAVEGLAAKRAQKYKPHTTSKKGFAEKVDHVLYVSDTSGIKRSEGRDIKLTVHTDRMDILQAAAEKGADTVYFGGSNLTRAEAETVRELEKALTVCQGRGIGLVISTPRIIREDALKQVKPLFEFARTQGLPVLAANLGTLREAVEYRLSEIYADYPLNIYNHQTLRWLADNCGISQAAVSPELTIEQIAGIARYSSVPLEAVVEGHLPLMITEYCPSGSLLGGLGNQSKCKHPCPTGHARGLKDRLGLVFPVAHDEFCLTSIYNAKELSMIGDIYPLYKAGISRLRIEISIEDPNRAASVIGYWRSELDRFTRGPEEYRPDPQIKEKVEALSPAGLTKGHYYRGVE